MARFSLDSTLASAIALRAVRAACDRSASVALDNLGPRNERSERNSLNTRTDGTTLSDPGVSLHALTAKPSRNFFFGLG